VAQSTTSVPRGVGRERYLDALWIERILRQETVGGGIIMLAAALAIIAANSPLADAYFGLRDAYITLGIGDLEAKISVGKATADGLLAIFFFLVRLELKRELLVVSCATPPMHSSPLSRRLGE